MLCIAVILRALQLRPLLAVAADLHRKVIEVERVVILRRALGLIRETAEEREGQALVRRLQRDIIHLEVSGQRTEEDHIRTRTGIRQTRGAHRGTLTRVAYRRSTRTIHLPRGVGIHIRIGAGYRSRTNGLGVDQLILHHFALLHDERFGLVNCIRVREVELHLTHTAIGRCGHRDLHLGRTLTLHGREGNPLATLADRGGPGAIGRYGKGGITALHRQRELLDIELEVRHSHIFVVIHASGKRHGRNQHHHQERQPHPKHLFHTFKLLAFICFMFVFAVYEYPKGVFAFKITLFLTFSATSLHFFTS